MRGPANQFQVSENLYWHQPFAVTLMIKMNVNNNFPMH